MKAKSHLTAISRKTLPKPTQWLMKQGLIRGRVLDYGCGKCAPINPIDWINYDPYHYPCLVWPSFDTIICNYVLCVLQPKERKHVLKTIHFLLKSDGKAYISVRNDRPDRGWGYSKKGTYQGRVRKLNLPLVHEERNFRIYLLTPQSKVI